MQQMLHYFLIEKDFFIIFGRGKNLHSKHNSPEHEMDSILILPYVIIAVILVTHFTGEVEVFHLFSVLADQCSSSAGSSP